MKRFGWPRPSTTWFERIRARFLLKGLKATTDVVTDGAVNYFITDDQPLVRGAIELLNRFPDEKKRVQRQLAYVCVAFGDSEYATSERFAFIGRKHARSVSEFVIELNELAVNAWHRRIGGGLQSRAWYPTVAWSIHRYSHEFAVRVLRREKDEVVHERVLGRYPELAGE